MADHSRPQLDLRTASGREVAEAMTRGVIDALRAHKRAGNPVVVWDWAKGEIVTVPPEQIPEFPEDDNATTDRLTP